MQTYIRVSELPRLSYSASDTATIAGGDTVEQLEVIAYHCFTTVSMLQWLQKVLVQRCITCLWCHLKDAVLCAGRVAGCKACA